ncbi:MAG: VWA domain-containing protein [Kiritimatiellae bacterium]|nr:VWA domain-containing protein [Kiritimatiellia bacterium]
MPASDNSGLPALLRGAGVALETRTPAELDLAPSALSAWSGVLVENRRADDFGPVGLANLAAWVRDAGGGLALTGGRNAFGPGGWHKSPVEDILPVSLELRREHRKFPMAIAVALDRSGSMSMPVGGGFGGARKMDLADQATAEVLDMLADDDRIAVWAVDTEAHLVVPLQPAAKARDARKKILAIESMGGGICIEEALVAALGALRASDAPIRHLIVFADAADSAQHPGTYRELARAAREAGITVSAIGLGSPNDSDAHILRSLAEAGGGLCEFTEDAGELPRLFAQDTMVAARDVMVTNPTLPRFTAALPQLSSRLPLEGAPAVGGYDLTYLRPEGTAAAVTTDDNAAPLLAFRPVGAGRTAVFTGEADGDLAGPFARWEHAPEFHAALARFAAGSADASPAGPAFPLALPRLTPTSLDIDLYPPSAIVPSSQVPGSQVPEPANLRTCEPANVQLTVLRTSASGRTQPERVPLEWSAPDRLSASIPLRGGETVLPVLSDPATGATRTLPPARLPYSPEYAPDPDGAGEALLASLADLTGGQRFADPATVWSLLPRAPVPFELAPFLYLLAALLLLLDIFDRRTAFLSRRATAREERKVQTVEKVEEVERVETVEKSAKRKSTPSTPSTPSTISTPAAPPPPDDSFARAKRRSASRTRGA